MKELLLKNYGEILSLLSFWSLFFFFFFFLGKGLHDINDDTFYFSFSNETWSYLCFFKFFICIVSFCGIIRLINVHKHSASIVNVL